MVENEHWKLIDCVWNLIDDAVNDAKKKYPELVFHSEKKDMFAKEYQKDYNCIMKEFMSDDTEALDAHKQAALIAICCLKLDIIEYHAPAPDRDDFSVLPEMIIINISLSYMLDCLNDFLKKKKIKKSLERYYLPVALACDTPYEKSMCRILYYERTRSDMSFNVLELADRFFLLEYINLLQHGIEPYLLKDNV